MRKSSNIKKAFAVLMALIMLSCMWSIAVSAEDECQHVFSLKTIVEPTCTVTGVEGLVCTICGYPDQSSYSELPMLEHSYSWAETVETSCSAPGEKQGVCSGCGKVITKEIPVVDHILGEYVQTKAPTCSAVGTLTAVCRVCGAHKTKDIETLPHDVRTMNAVAPTCTKSGLTEGKCCYVCKAVLVQQEKIPALGHAYYIDVITPPTCTSKGVGYKICANDPLDKERVDIPKLGHTDADEDGICETCGEEIPCTCFCHQDTMFAKFVRFIDTLLSRLLKKDFRCCPDMLPYPEPVENPENEFGY